MPSQLTNRRFWRLYILEALYQEPLLLFSRLHEVEQSLAWNDFVDLADSSAKVASLHESLHKWSREWHLDADWCREISV
jgi:hypothetical protein